MNLKYFLWVLKKVSKNIELAENLPMKRLNASELFKSPILLQPHFLCRSLIHGRLLKKLEILFTVKVIVGCLCFQHSGLDSPSSSPVLWFMSQVSSVLSSFLGLSRSTLYTSLPCLLSYMEFPSPLAFSGLSPGVYKLFLKGSNNTYFRFCRPYDLIHNHSTQPLQRENRHRQ